jgi:hypothetical protein
MHPLLQYNERYRCREEQSTIPKASYLLDWAQSELDNVKIDLIRIADERIFQTVGRSKVDKEGNESQTSDNGSDDSENGENGANGEENGANGDEMKDSNEMDRDTPTLLRQMESLKVQEAPTAQTISDTMTAPKPTFMKQLMAMEDTSSTVRSALSKGSTWESSQPEFSRETTASPDGLAAATLKKEKKVDLEVVEEKEEDYIMKDVQ